VTEQAAQTAEYRCPGEKYPISRSVHLGRLARFYPKCRRCVHRDDTGTLSTRLVQRLAETRFRGELRPLFHEEGAGGFAPDDLDPAAARDIAAALGVSLRRQADRPPVFVLAGDGRALACEMIAAVAEGLRFAGCEVVDVGPATTACLAFTVSHLAADGGVLVGNPSDTPHGVGLKFFDAHPQPLAHDGPLRRLEKSYRTGIERPSRTGGSLRRFQARVPYLETLVEHYHALRPLRLVLDSAGAPLVRYLRELAEPTACEIIPRRTIRDEFSEQIAADRAHLAARIDGDGEACELFDEQGRRVPAERLLPLLARHLRIADARRVVVLEQGTSPSSAGAIGPRLELSDARRPAMAAAMREHGAIFGGGPSGRFWYSDAGPPLLDALRTVTLLLVLLSRSDRAFSEVLDRETP